MKKFAILLTLLLLPWQVSFGQVAGEFGVLISENDEPTFMYAGGVGLPIPGFLQPLIEAGQATAFYSDRRWSEGAEEMYGVRIQGEHDFSVWGNLTLESGVGVWYFFNTAGGDVARTATMGGLGYNAGSVEITLGADLISVKNGPDMYVARFGLSVGL